MHARMHEHIRMLTDNSPFDQTLALMLVGPSHIHTRTHTHGHTHTHIHTHTYTHTITNVDTQTHRSPSCIVCHGYSQPSFSRSHTRANTPPLSLSLSLCHHPSLSLAHMTHTVSCPLVAMSADHLSLSSSLPVSLTHTHTVSCPLVATLAYSSARVWYRSMFNLLSSALILLPRPQQE